LHINLLKKNRTSKIAFAAIQFLWLVGGTACTSLPQVKPAVSADNFLNTLIKPQQPFSFEGFRENSLDHGHLIYAPVEQATAQALLKKLIRAQGIFIRNKSELTQALIACANDRSHCPAPIKGFVDMLTFAHQIKSQALQAMAVNGYFNTTMAYDLSEARPYQPHRTMVQALIAKHGVCDEDNQLKLVAEEYLHLPVDNVRKVVVSLDGEWAPHSVVDIRTPSQIWILNNVENPETGLRENSNKAHSKINSATALAYFNYAAALGIDNGRVSRWGLGGYDLPIYAYNSSEGGVYDSASSRAFSPNSVTIPEFRIIYPSKIDQNYLAIMRLAYDVIGVQVINPGRKRNPLLQQAASQNVLN